MGEREAPIVSTLLFLVSNLLFFPEASNIFFPMPAWILSPPVEDRSKNSAMWNTRCSTRSASESFRSSSWWMVSKSASFGSSSGHSGPAPMPAVLFPGPSQKPLPIFPDKCVKIHFSNAKHWKKNQQKPGLPQNNMKETMRVKQFATQESPEKVQGENMWVQKKSPPKNLEKKTWNKIPHLRKPTGKIREQKNHPTKVRREKWSKVTHLKKSKEKIFEQKKPLENLNEKIEQNTSLQRI